jgi:two-component system, NtrC family, nitrogen regulation response regulator GlnG
VQLADLDTVDPLSSSRDGPDPEVVALTILAHPDVARVGEVAALFGASTGGAKRVSRLEPEFQPANGGQGRPLASAMVSRRPVLILSIRKGAHHALMLDPGKEPARVSVDGVVIERMTELDPKRLRRGFIIELGGCVLMLLHSFELREPGDDLGLVGDSEGIRDVRAAILRVADQDTAVLIRGESGSGKELVARAIHELSRRSKQSYVPVNAAAIPAAMAPAALFGHTRGAFTGAVDASPGFFGQAERGTLFLDEIGEAGRDVQALLLRAIREGEIQPVGATQPRRVDVRVISATDADLEGLVERGEFLEPLLRRLESFTVRVPPLRERRDDIARLFFRFLREELDNVHELHKLDVPRPGARPWMPASAVHALIEYDWPGNVAELQTVARRIVLTNRGLARLTLDLWLINRLPRGGDEVDSVQGPAAAPKRRPRSYSDLEIALAMREAHYKVGAAAERLGVSRAWLHTRLEFCQGVRQAKDLSADEVTRAYERFHGVIRDMAEALEVSEHGLKMRLRSLGLGGDRGI